MFRRDSSGPFGSLCLVAIFSNYPALGVEMGAVFVLVAALVSRILLNRAGIPSIVTLLAFGLLAGPSVLNLLRLDLTNPAVRALLSLAVVIVLFEATLRIDVAGIPKRALALLMVFGASGTLLLVPVVAHAYGLSRLVGSMIAAICIVTGPTVIGPLMARLRPRSAVAHLLESEGLALDALGVIIAAVAFATYTSRAGGAADLFVLVTQRVGAGILVGVAWGTLGRFVLRIASGSSSDVSKIGLLLLGVGAYATAEWLSHESGLVAVVACGLLLDVRPLPHERLLRSFKEDLSMLALSIVFVLLSSQIQVQRLGPQLLPAAAITGLLVLIRLTTVGLATIGAPYTLGERLLMATVFPRGIVAVSLATYYATQIPAWGLRGGGVLVGTLFLIVVMTIAVSTPSALLAAKRLHLQMPAVVVAGISPSTLETARLYKEAGHLPLLVDIDERAVALARSHDLEAITLSSAAALIDVVRRKKARFLVLDEETVWSRLGGSGMPGSVTVLVGKQANVSAGGLPVEPGK